MILSEFDLAVPDPLTQILADIGFAERPQQRALYEHLLGTSRDGVVVQAGTGTGKSIAVLAAAAYWREATGKQSLVVTPTKALQDQYMLKDGPAVQAALGYTVVTLKGRNNYVCSSAEAFSLTSDPVPHWAAREYDRALEVLEGGYDPNTAFTSVPGWFGCPGGDTCEASVYQRALRAGEMPETGMDAVCMYLPAREAARDADIVVTNTHLFVIDAQVKAAGGQDPQTGAPLGVFRDLGVVLVDEAHALEGTLRDFSTQAISLKTLESMGPAGEPLATFLRRANRGTREATAVPASAARKAITALAGFPVTPDARQRQADAARAARKILTQMDGGWYESGDIVLWFNPAQAPKSPRLVSTTINLSGQGRSLLTVTPFGMVSATVPSTLRSALGIRAADYHDVGHPFDYARQGRLAFSTLKGDYKSAREPGNIEARADAICERVLAAGGGALLLFSAFRDLEAVYTRIAPRLRYAGLRVLVQDRDIDKAALAREFKADGNAVLFGSDTFATGFDCPGDALRLVVLFKLPYPGLDPVTKAIMNKSRSRYEDMMLVKAVQAAGRLIRTPTDTGTVYVADARARAKFRNTTDPMVAHMRDWTLEG